MSDRTDRIARLTRKLREDKLANVEFLKARIAQFKAMNDEQYQRHIEESVGRTIRRMATTLR